MAKRSIIIVLCAVIAAAFAIPIHNTKELSRDQHSGNHLSARDETCMSDADAQQVAKNFAAILSNYTEDIAKAALTENFTEYSSSTNYLIDSSCSNGPVGLDTVLFTSRASLMAGQGAQPSIPFEILNVWHGCDSVTLRWKSAQKPQEVIGVIAMETVKAPSGSKYPWQISGVYSEFNAGAWLVDLGVYVPTCGLSTELATET